MKRILAVWRILLTAVILCSEPASLKAQQEAEPVRPVTSSLMLGGGTSSQRHTFLTPLRYDGLSLGVAYDRFRSWRSPEWHSYQLLDATFAAGHDENRNSHTWSGRVRYHYAVEHGWELPHQIRLLVGPYSSLDAGFDYNLKMSNANNPAVARAVINSGLSCQARWPYSLRHQSCGLDFTMQMPLVGIAMMPHYGASYYEAFYLGTANDYLHFSSLHNQQDLNLRLTTDLPVALVPGLGRFGTAVRVGMAYHIETMRINDITSRFSSFQFILGWTWQHVPYKPYCP